MDRRAGGHWWLCLRKFLQEHSETGPAQSCALPALSHGSMSSGGFSAFNILWSGVLHQQGNKMLRVTTCSTLERLAGVGMGQDLILRLHPHPCAGTPQPLHPCSCFSPFLVPKLISNSLLNHSLRNCFANKLWAWVLEENNLIIGCCLFSSLRDL